MKRRGALVGFGQVAEKAHAPAFLSSPALELAAAVAEERPERRAAAAKALPGAKVYESLPALLSAERGLDFAIIATPPFLHASQALASLDAGLAVLCEKPLAVDPVELDALILKARQKKRALMTVHNWAHAPQWRKTAELVASGALGAVRHASLEVLRTKPAASAQPGDWRRQARQAGGGILVDHGWHALYLLRRLVPGALQRVSAAWHHAAGEVEDDASVLFEFQDAAAFLHLSWRASRRANVAAVHGSAGSLELRDDHLLLWRGTGAPERTDFAEALSAGSAHPGWLESFLPEFAAAVEDPRRGEANLEEAVFCARAIHRAYQALAAGREAVRAGVPSPFSEPRPA